MRAIPFENAHSVVLFSINKFSVKGVHNMAPPTIYKVTVFNLLIYYLIDGSKRP